MTSTTNNDRLLLAAVQRAAVRLYFAQQEHIPGRQIREHLETVYELASLGLNGRRATELAAAYYGQYNAGDPTIPVLPPDSRANVHLAALKEEPPEEDSTDSELPSVEKVSKKAKKKSIDALLEIPYASPVVQVRPEHVFSREEMRRYFAVQAASGTPTQLAWDAAVAYIFGEPDGEGDE